MLALTMLCYTLEGVLPLLASGLLQSALCEWFMGPGHAVMTIRVFTVFTESTIRVFTGCYSLVAVWHEHVAIGRKNVAPQYVQSAHSPLQHLGLSTCSVRPGTPFLYTSSQPGPRTSLLAHKWRNSINVINTKSKGALNKVGHMHVLAEAETCSAAASIHTECFPSTAARGVPRKKRCKGKVHPVHSGRRAPACVAQSQRREEDQQPEGGAALLPIGCLACPLLLCRAFDSSLGEQTALEYGLTEAVLAVFDHAEVVLPSPVQSSGRELERRTVGLQHGQGTLTGTCSGA